MGIRNQRTASVWFKLLLFISSAPIHILTEMIKTSIRMEVTMLTTAMNMKENMLYILNPFCALSWMP